MIHRQLNVICWNVTVFYTIIEHLIPSAKENYSEQKSVQMKYFPPKLGKLILGIYTYKTVKKTHPHEMFSANEMSTRAQKIYFLED